MDRTFVAVAEDRPGAAWQRRFVTAWPLVRPWYLQEGLVVRRVDEVIAKLTRIPYTAVYRPVDPVVDYLWPGHEWRQTFDHIEPGAYTHVYGVPGRAHGPLAV